MYKTLLACLPLFVLSTYHISAQHHTSTGPDSARSAIHQTILRQQLLSETGFIDKEVKMVRVDFPPGSVSGPHRHPCPTFGYLLEGELESVFEGKTYQYKKGDTFYEHANGLHSRARNPSSTQPAVLLVFFIPTKDQATSVPAK